SAVQEQRGEPMELFRRALDGTTCDRMRFAAEVLLDPTVRDPWGTTVSVRYSRLRYEVTIERRRDERDVERLVVVAEQASPILSRRAAWQTPLHPWRPFRREYLKCGRREPFLDTGLAEGRVAFNIHQDGRAGRTRPAEAAEATVLSSITSAEYPHLYALR